MLGRIKELKPGRPYGYITATDGVVYFFHHDGFIGELSDIAVDLRVAFTVIEQEHRGVLRKKAINVAPVTYRDILAEPRTADEQRAAEAASRELKKSRAQAAPIEPPINVVKILTAHTERDTQQTSPTTETTSKNFVRV